MNKNAIVVFDCETIANFFSYVAIDTKSNEEETFVIWKEQNDLPQLLQHLNNIGGMIGFNSVGFDYPVLHYVLKNKKRMLLNTGEEIAREIYDVAQETIHKEYADIRKPLIPQLDLFKIRHYDNFAKSCSLKKLEMAMRMDNVMDMPHHHAQDVVNQKQVEQILAYNKHDVIATKMFYEKTKDMINLRRGIKKKYGLDCINFSDSKLGEQLMLQLYCQRMDLNPTEVKKLRTHRSHLRFSECIPSYVEFETPEFKELLTYIKSIVVGEYVKGCFAYAFEFKGFTFDMGVGGIHGCIKGGVYESDDDYIIIDSDVKEKLAS